MPSMVATVHFTTMVVGTTTSVKHNLKVQQVESESTGDHHGQTTIFDNKEEMTETSSHRGEAKGRQTGSSGKENTSEKHQSHNLCKSCGSLANKCSCKECECQVCSSKSRNVDPIEPAIKSATSSTIVCGGGCIRAAERAATGGCPACECPADGCPCTKCGCPICGPHQMASNPTPCCGGNEARQRAAAGNCPACGCPTNGCPCTGCKCPVCMSS